MKTFPTLYHKGKSGELRQWRTWADGDTMFTEHGMVGGALQRSAKKCIAKNLGRSNETTASEQAESESQSAHTFKLERKYSLTQAEAQLPLLLPMLAHKYEPKKHNDGKYFAQPKLDGVRCIARWENNRVVLYSRQGKIYNVSHVSEELATFMGKDDVYDGELYIHGMPLQSQISLVKKPQPESIEVKYYVYDVPVVDGDDSLGFSTRYFAKYSELEGHDYIQPVKTVDLTNCNAKTFPAILKEFQTGFIEAGYEGLMLRGADSNYLWGYRSSELLKVKTFQDSEFYVVDVIEGVGKMAGHAIFVCKNDLSNDLFRVVPKTTMDERKAMYDKKSKYIGCKYTVKYFDRTEDLLPRFPVGLAFREDV